LATTDKSGKLLVGAAVKANANSEPDIKRIQALSDAGCNIIIVDAQNGDNFQQIELIKIIKKHFPDMDVIAGNIVRVSQAKKLLDAGADGLRIGMGVGSVATTQLVKAVGRAQLSSIYACALVARKYGVPVIADGGICNTGCLIKALAIGANCVMMGSLLAGVDESPGDYFFQEGMRLKHYRGNHTQSPVSKPTDQYKPAGGNISGAGSMETPSEFRLATGVSGAVVDKGPLSQYFPYLCQSVRHGLQDMGVLGLTQMSEQLHRGELRFELRSPSAQKEGGVHDLHSFQQRLYA
jgi:IMP dehydrogenase